MFRSIFVTLGGYLIAVFAASICITSVLILGMLDEAGNEAFLSAIKIYFGFLIIIFILTTITALPGFLLSLVAAYVMKKDSYLFFIVSGVFSALIAIGILFGPAQFQNGNSDQETKTIISLWIFFFLASGALGVFTFALWNKRMFHRA